MALTDVIARCERHDAIDAVLLFEHTLCANSLFALKCDRLDHFSTSDSDKGNWNVTISSEFNCLIFLMFMEL